MSPEVLAQTLGFVSIEVVGEGTFKTVYKATDPDGDTRALKILKRSPSERDKRELDSMARCDHPSIVKIHGSGSIKSSAGEISYVLEDFVEGGSLRDLINTQGLLTPQECLEMLIQMAPVLDHMRDQMVVHRDIKPANILVKPGPHFILTDFGIARVLDMASLTKDFVNSGPGTAYFASPEQFNNDKQMIDWRSDQFNLGVCAYNSVYGSHPYAEGNEDIGVVLGRLSNRIGPSTTAVKRLQEDGLGAVVKLIEPWPFARYMEYDQLRGALEA